ncbi:hypothetical protein PQX77_005029 [Marasmius sp. AFHP31]|nr:hypothetical protein PQX77_005029 [Marasmius sp. AFHP31]
MISFKEASSTIPTQSHSFDDRLKSSNLPLPGPSYYEARRALWLKPNGHRREPPPPSTSRHKLETLLNSPNAVNDNNVWKGGIEKVWKGLSSGVTLKKRLPMAMVIKIIHCAWIKDETWPSGAVAPEPDDILEDPPVGETSRLLGTSDSQGVATEPEGVLLQTGMEVDDTQHIPRLFNERNGVRRRKKAARSAVVYEGKTDRTHELVIGVLIYLLIVIYLGVHFLYTQR